MKRSQALLGLLMCTLALTHPAAAARRRVRGAQIVAALEAAGLDGSHLLQYPPQPMPAKACACRMDAERRPTPTACPSPWDSLAGSSKVLPSLKLTAEGDILDESSGEKVALRGVNWFGWETATPSMDGLWAYNDDELPPLSAVSNESLAALQLDFNAWGKRTMTNDFAHVVHRMKALGFNAVRLPMNFTNLQRPISRDRDYPSDLYACVRDSIDHINLEKTLDPELANLPATDLAAAAPAYTGMLHPPPASPDDDPACSLPWEAPFASDYQAPKQFGDRLQLTLCNWYIPSSNSIQGVHRFLWQVQYLVAQGFYVLIDHSSYLEKDPNMLSPALFAANWGNLWRIMTELPGYNSNLRGRVFPDLVNEPSRWGCQWERDCIDAAGQKSCAAGTLLYHEAMKAIHTWDPTVPVFANALGQAGVDANRFPSCSSFYKGMNFGDGTITQKHILESTGISDPSQLFKGVPDGSTGKLALSPHIYPSTLTGWGEDTQQRDELFKRLDLSFGLKSLGQDVTSDGKPLRRTAVVLGEFGVFGQAGTNPHSRERGETDISQTDIRFLRDLSDYLKGMQQRGATIGWFWWALNANSGDTKGILGPGDSWREVQFNKVRLLTELYGLRPWYCQVAPGFCGDSDLVSRQRTRKPVAGAEASKPGKQAKVLKVRPAQGNATPVVKRRNPTTGGRTGVLRVARADTAGGLVTTGRHLMEAAA